MLAQVGIVFGPLNADLAIMATASSTNQGIVVGGGLAGSTAANTLLENGARVVVVEKFNACGGNFMLYTSGINAKRSPGDRRNSCT